MQDFLRMRKKAVMDFTFLDKCFLAIRPETWKRVNELLGRYGVGQGAVNPKVIRTDTTVVESNNPPPCRCQLHLCLTPLVVGVFSTCIEKE